MVLLVFAAWLDLVWELSPTARIALVWGAGAVGAMLLVVLAYRTARTARPAALARRLDIAVNSSGEILTGWELDCRVGRVKRVPPSSVSSVGLADQRCVGARRPTLLLRSTDSTAEYPPLTAGLVTMAAEHAESLARRAPLGKAVPAKPLGRALAVLAALATAIGLLALVMPDLVKTEWNRFRRPEGRRAAL